MITLDINNNNLTINGLNENDIWGLEVIDGNFMLSKYNGIAKSEIESVNIITFPNLGETYGKIKLYLNEKPCYNTITLNGTQYITPKYFSVEPKEIIFNKKGETAIINVFSSDIDWDYDTSLEGISLSDDGETITVESNTNDSFKYDLIVFDRNLGITESVKLIQGNVNDLNSNTLIVSPTFVNLSNDNKTFNVHVTSLCDNSDNYTYKSNTNDIKVVKNGNLLKCEVTKDTFKNGTIEISNECYTKTVSVVYSEEKENEETYIYIVGVDGVQFTSKVTEYDFIFKDTNLHKFEISSNPIWKISGLIPENKLSMNKVGNILNASLNDYEALSSGGKITLKTRDDKHTAIINYTVANGLVTSNTKTFVLTNSNGSGISTEKNLVYNESRNSVIGIKAYNSNGNLLKWNTQSVEFDLLRYTNGSWNEIQTYSGGSENSLVYISIGHIQPTNENYLWLSATTNTINNYTKTDYTYNFIEYGGNGLTCKLNINYNRQGDCEETTSITYSNYHVEYVGDSVVECNERADAANVIVTATKTTKIINSFCVTTSTETEDNVQVNDFILSYSPNTDNDTSSNRLVTCTVKSNNGEVIGEFTYTQKIGNCYTCETAYTSVEFDCSNIGKCDTTVSVTNVKAVGTYSCSNDSSGKTETNLKQNEYTVIVSPEITENTTSDERNFTVTVTSSTLNISGKKTITQAAGPCQDVYVFETVFNPLEGKIVSSSGVTFTPQGFLSTKNGEYCPITATPTCDWITIDNISSGTVGDNGNVSANISFAANETTENRSCDVVYKQNGSNKEIIHSFTQEGKAGCGAYVVYDYLTVTVSAVAKCDTSASFSIIANGTYTDESCETVPTSSTLTYGNYEVKYGTSSGNYTLDSITENNTSSSKTWYYKITATSSIYNGLTYTGSFIQDAGPCKSPYVSGIKIQNTSVGSISYSGFGKSGSIIVRNSFEYTNKEWYSSNSSLTVTVPVSSISNGDYLNTSAAIQIFVTGTNLSFVSTNVPSGIRNVGSNVGSTDYYISFVVVPESSSTSSSSLVGKTATCVFQDFNNTTTPVTVNVTIKFT